jgi:hypothetical protein
MPYVNNTDGEFLSVESALEWFVYEKESGRLFRRMAGGNLREIGTERPDGYRVFGYNRRMYRTTYLIWLLIYGRPPNGDVDHIDNITSDDKLSNLRECSRSQNMQNASLSKRNKSGIKGVNWDSTRQKWAVYIRSNERNINVGRFDTIEEATEARLQAERELFEGFGR